MSMSILNNISALTAQNNLSATQASLQKTLTQLSSGSKINSGSDDAAGLAIANGLSASITALTQSSQNATNGTGMLQTADGALSEVTTLLNRAVTLATEASTSGLTKDQMSALNNEFTSIQNEITNIGKTTTFNGSAVFGTSTDANTVASNDTGLTSATVLSSGTLSVKVGSDSYNFAATRGSTLGGANSFVASVNAQTGATGIQASVTNGHLQLKDILGRGNIAVVSSTLNYNGSSNSDVLTGNATTALTAGGLINSSSDGTDKAVITVGGTAHNFAITSTTTNAALVTAINNANIGVTASISTGNLTLTDTQNRGDLAFTTSGTGAAADLAKLGTPVASSNVLTGTATMTGSAIDANAATAVNLVVSAGGKSATYAVTSSTTVQNLVDAINNNTTAGANNTNGVSAANPTGVATGVSASLVGGKLVLSDANATDNNLAVTANGTNSAAVLTALGMSSAAGNVLQGTNSSAILGTATVDSNAVAPTMFTISAGGVTTSYAITSTTTDAELVAAINANTTTGANNTNGVSAAHPNGIATGVTASIASGSLVLTDTNNSGNLAVSASGPASAAVLTALGGPTDTNSLTGSANLQGTGVINSSASASSQFIITKGAVNGAGGTATTYQITGATTNASLVAAINANTGATGVTAAIDSNGHFSLTDASGAGSNLSISSTGTDAAQILTNLGSVGANSLVGSASVVGTTTIDAGAASTIVVTKNGTSTNFAIGASETIGDLATAITTAGIGVTATVDSNGHFLMTDAAGAGSNLSITATGTNAAATLGALGNPSANTLVGSGAALTGTSVVDSNLSAVTISAGGISTKYGVNNNTTNQNLVDAINGNTSTTGVSASIASGKLVLTDANKNNNLAIAYSGTGSAGISTEIGAPVVDPNVLAGITTGLNANSGGNAVDAAVPVASKVTVTVNGLATDYAITSSTTVNQLMQAINNNTTTGANNTNGVSTTNTTGVATGVTASLVGGKLVLTDLNDNSDIAISASTSDAGGAAGILAALGNPAVNQNVLSGDAALMAGNAVSSSIQAASQVTISAGGVSTSYAISSGETAASLVTAINNNTTTGANNTNGVDLAHPNGVATGVTAAINAAGKLTLTDTQNRGNIQLSTSGTDSANLLAALGAPSVTSAGGTAISQFSNSQVQDLNTVQGSTSTVSAGTTLGSGGALTTGDLVVTAGSQSYTFVATANETIGGLISDINNSGHGLQASITSAGAFNLTDTSGNGNISVNTANSDAVVTDALGLTTAGASSYTNPAVSATNRLSVFLSDSSAQGTSTVSVNLNQLDSGHMGNGSGIATNDLLSTTDAAAALTAINQAISSIAAFRGNIGAGVNQLAAASNVMSNESTNLTSAESGISDADIGKTVANMSKYNTLSQTGIAALQQANQASQSILKLLQ